MVGGACASNFMGGGCVVVWRRVEPGHTRAGWSARSSQCCRRGLVTLVGEYGVQVGSCGLAGSGPWRAVGPVLAHPADGEDDVLAGLPALLVEEGTVALPVVGPYRLEG